VRLVLVSGIPASGKTEFGKWLAEHHRFRHEDLENGKHMTRLERKTPKAFIDEIRGGRSDLVLDWGFPPHAQGLKTVRGVVEAGLTRWWFDGDRAAARESFERRTGHPATVDDLDRQLRPIDSAWREIVDIFGEHRLDAIGPGPAYLSSEAIFDAMFGHPQAVS